MIGPAGIDGTLAYRAQPGNPRPDGGTGDVAAAGSGVQQAIADQNPSGIRQKKTEGPEECQTCKNRRYQDGSDDPGVSFKSPTALTPEQAATAVISHEREHYNRETVKAQEEGREVVSNSIRVYTAICPECGKAYVAGGETRTVTRKKQESLPFAQDFFERTVGRHLTGREVDVKT